MWPFATDSLTKAALILRRLAWADGASTHPLAATPERRRDYRCGVRPGGRMW